VAITSTIGIKGDGTDEAECNTDLYLKVSYVNFKCVRIFDCYPFDISVEFVLMQ
jgi:hypothetical protein